MPHVFYTPSTSLQSLYRVFVKPWRNWLTTLGNTLLFVSESLTINKKVTSDLKPGLHIKVGSHDPILVQLSFQIFFV